MEKARVMFKKIFTSVVLMSLVTSCSGRLYRERPVAMNRPKSLPLGESRSVKRDSEMQRGGIAPITSVKRENVYYPISKTTMYSEEKAGYDDLSDILEDMSYAPKTYVMEDLREPSTTTLPDAQEESIEENKTSFNFSFRDKRKAEDGNFRIAVLLPLETQNAKAAQDLKNAATMALFDAKSDNTIIQIYSTDGTFDGAKAKAKLAYKDGADIIVGPLFADEVKGVKSFIDGNIPIVSFTTDPSVLGKNVYSVGFLMEQQIKRIVKYATSKGKKKFGVIAPKSESGEFVRDYFDIYTNEYGAKVVSNVAYEKNSKELMNAVKELANFDNRKEEYNSYKKAVKDRYNYLLKLKEKDEQKFLAAFDKEQFKSSEDELAALEKELDNLEKKMTVSEPEFDAVFIFGDDINDVVMIGSALMYYDVHPDKVKYLGTAQLENAKVYNERAFRGAWFPSVSTKYSGKFETAYKKYFNREPIKIASLAYDSISLVNSIGESKGYLDKKDLLNPNGWTGINGSFRFKADGASERNMDIKEVVGGASVKTKVISPAETNFLHY